MEGRFQGYHQVCMKINENNSTRLATIYIGIDMTGKKILRISWKAYHDFALKWFTIIYIVEPKTTNRSSEKTNIHIQ